MNRTNRRETGAGADGGNGQPPGRWPNFVGGVEEAAADARMKGDLAHEHKQRDLIRLYELNVE